MVLLFRFFSRWPLPVLHALGGVLGWLVWCCSPSYRRNFRLQMSQAGLAFSQVRPAIAEAGRMACELPRLWMRPHHESCLSQVQVQGREAVDALRAQGRGLIFFSVHGGSFELAPQALAELYGPVTALYRPSRQSWLARLMKDSRHRPGLAMAPASMAGIRQMLKALRGGGSVAMLTDQVPPEGLGLWAPFFGRPAYTMTLAARLALQSRAALVPYLAERLGGGRGYRLHLLPPLAEFDAQPLPDLQQSVQLINQANEALILSLPGQYLWAYARYKQPRREAGLSGQAS
ncbi:MAG: lysophospholipid acyltransferase family protein [Betaproteobacteria bacterium]